MFSKKKNLRSAIIELLVNGQMGTVTLIEALQRIRPATTKQGVYKALAELKRDEIVVLNREGVSLSSLWIKKLIDFIEQAKSNYTQDSQKGLSFLSLKEGERVSYSFKTFEDADRFWIHAFDALVDTTRSEVPVLIYNPHEWFLLARTESELYLFDRLLKRGRTLMSLVAEKDPLDRYSKKYFNNKNFQYHALGEYPFISKYNVNVFDDFLIEVHLDQKITDEIDLVYKKYNAFSLMVREELTAIIRKKGKNKLVISRNRKRAEKVRNLFRKYFTFHGK